MTKHRAIKTAQQSKTLEPVTSKTVAPVETSKIQTSLRKLTEAEVKQLAECEAVIKNGITAFKAVAEALLEINEKELYKAEFETFQDYCRVKWDISARHGNRLMLAGEVVKNIESDQLVSSVPTAVPKNESQARPLESLTKPQQIEAARKVAEKTKNPTTKDFQAAADEVTEKIPQTEKSNDSTNDQSDVRPKVESYDPRKEGLNETENKTSKVKDTGDLKKLLEIVDKAETVAKNIPDCSDVVKTLHELGKVITRKLNGGNK